MPLTPKILGNNLAQLNTQFTVDTNQLNLSIFTEISIKIRVIAGISPELCIANIHALRYYIISIDA